ncbi:3305_t:CDS:2 [Gigaspora rosea]|nr:3305_t:CDS:2 [Gigaspora rosea]
MGWVGLIQSLIHSITLDLFQHFTPVDPATARILLFLTPVFIHCLYSHVTRG